MPARTRTQDAQDSTDEVARDRTERLERDLRDVDARLGEMSVAHASVATELQALRREFGDHRTHSDTQHGTTQAAIAAVAKRLDALGGGQGGPGGSGAAGSPPGGVLASVPPAAWGGVGTLVGTALAAALLGIATALGWSVPASPATPPPAPIEVAAPVPTP